MPAFVALGRRASHPLAPAGGRATHYSVHRSAAGGTGVGTRGGRRAGGGTVPGGDSSGRRPWRPGGAAELHPRL